MVSSPRALRNYINGAFVDPHGESRADIISPVTGGVVATAPISDAADVDAAYAAASAAFKEWGRTTPATRQKALLDIAGHTRSVRAFLIPGPPDLHLSQSPPEDPRPRGQTIEVGDTEAAPRAREQSHEVVTARRVLNHPEKGHEIRDLRGVQQSPETDDLVGDTLCLERRDDRVELGSLAAQDRCGPSRAARTACNDPLDDRVRLRLDGGEAADRDVASPSVATSRQGLDRDARLRAQRSSHLIGHLEDVSVVAPTRGQGQHRRARTRTEVVAKLAQRGGTGAPPAVDRLMGIADGRHGHWP